MGKHHTSLVTLAIPFFSFSWGSPGVGPCVSWLARHQRAWCLQALQKQVWQPSGFDEYHDPWTHSIWPISIMCRGLKQNERFYRGGKISTEFPTLIEMRSSRSPVWFSRIALSSSTRSMLDALAHSIPWPFVNPERSWEVEHPPGKALKTSWNL